MRATFEARRLAPAPGGAVVSIGVFDGVHRGHEAILAANVARAAALGAEPTVLTFRRHPKRVLLGRSPRTLTTLEHRLELFRRAGIRHTVALSFTPELRDLPAEEFVREIAVAGLGVRAFVLGFDSRFGRGRAGTPELLRELGFDVEVVPEVVVQGRAVSSTAIREAVELGDLDGRRAPCWAAPVSVLGRVVRGNQLGPRDRLPDRQPGPASRAAPTARGLCRAGPEVLAELGEGRRGGERAGRAFATSDSARPLPPGRRPAGPAPGRGAPVRLRGRPLRAAPGSCSSSCSALRAEERKFANLGEPQTPRSPGMPTTLGGPCGG